MGGGGGQRMGVETAPGSMGQMDNNQTYSEREGYGSTSFEDEPPLLEELGINFALIKEKVHSARRLHVLPSHRVHYYQQQRKSLFVYV